MADEWKGADTLALFEIIRKYIKKLYISGLYLCGVSLKFAA